jgi:DNA-binding MarR family transcriptional regulator
MAIAHGRKSDYWSTHRLLSTAARLDERRINRCLSGLGLTKSSFDVLDSAAELGPTSQNGLAAELGISPQSLGKILERLKELGFVTKERGTGDGRRRSIRLTRRGRSVLRAAAELVRGLPRPEPEVEAELRRHLERHISHLMEGPERVNLRES